MDAIPAAATILEATLSLHRQSGSGADQPVSAHRITNSWSEDSVSWNRRESGTNWDTAGGDFDNIAVATTPVGPANERYEWNITPLVQGWVDGSYPNYGVALVAAIAGMPGSDSIRAMSRNLDRRPSLSVTYACDCGEVCSTPQGSGKLLMVVVNPTDAGAPKIKRRRTCSNPGVTRSRSSARAPTRPSTIPQTADNDVVFISETVNSNQVGIKLANAPIGVVSQDGDYNPDLGLATGSTLKVGTDIDVTDTDHYITRVFPAGPLHLLGRHGTAGTAGAITGSANPGDIGGDASLVVLDKGDAMEGGGNAAGRRVMLPLGTRYRFNWDHLNANGRLLVQRALAWGTGNTGQAPRGLLWWSAPAAHQPPRSSCE